MTMIKTHSWEKKIYLAALLLRSDAQIRARFLALTKALADTSATQQLRHALGEMIALVEELLAVEKQNLSAAELDALSALHNDLWDAQIEEDSKNGALDFWIERVGAENAQYKKMAS